MKSLKEVSIGLIAGILTSLIVMGAILAGMTEGLVPVIPTAQPTLTQPVFAETPLPGEPSSTPMPTIPTSRPIMVTPTQTFAHCAVPQGWQLYTIQPGDKLSDLAAQRGVSLNVLMLGNCLAGTTLVVGTQLALPPMPTATFTPSVTPSLTFTVTPSSTLVPTLTLVSCGPPRGWVIYTVQSGDTLFHLSQAVHLSVAQVEFANCLSSDLIVTGQKLFLPFIPPRPTATLTPTIRPSNTAVRTFTFTPSNTPAPTHTPTSTPVPPSSTPIPPSPTPVPPTHTPTLSPIPPTPTNTPTLSPTPPAPTNTPTNTPTPSQTLVPPTNTPTVTPSKTPTRTQTLVKPSATPVTPTKTPTATPDPSPQALVESKGLVEGLAGSGILHAMWGWYLILTGTFFPAPAP